MVIGTPGRMLDLIETKVIPTDKVKYLVLDECDKVLDVIEMR